MKKLSYLLSVGFSLILFANTANAQDQAATFIQAGIKDAGYLTKSYLSPFAEAFGSSLNSGWYNTAKPHKLGRFDLTLTFATAFVPASEQSYIINDAELTNFRLANPSDNEASTFFGDKGAGPKLYLTGTNPITSQEEIIDSINAPGGIDFSLVPVPVANLSVGLIKKTEIMIRYIPTTSLVAGDFDGEISLIGFGVKHDINQYIPVLDKLPFNMSVMFGYTKLNFDIDVNVDPQYADPNNTDYSNQQITLETTSFTGRLLVSKKIALLTVYGGLGFNSSETEVKLAGNYPVITFDATAQPQSSPVTDPVNFSTNVGGFVGNIGARVKFLIFTVHADYTYTTNYDNLSVGLGINVSF